MGLLDKIKKSIELKQSTPSFESINKTENKILKLKKQFEKNPDNCKILTELYTCYVEISDTEKKIECLKKISQLSPNDFYSMLVRHKYIKIMPIKSKIVFRFFLYCDWKLVF